MSFGTSDIVRHNNWATEQVLAYCRKLDQSALNATAPGTYGTIIEILRHILDAESAYLFTINGRAPAFPWRRGEAAGLDVLSERASLLAAGWEQLLADGVDDERIVDDEGDDNDVFAIRIGVFIAQSFHHANEHRAQICTILGSIGLEPPDVSAWGYAFATGRLKPK